MQREASVTIEVGGCSPHEVAQTFVNVLHEWLASDPTGEPFFLGPIHIAVDGVEETIAIDCVTN